MIWAPRTRRGWRPLGIATVDGPCHAVAALNDAIVVDTPHGHHTFDSVYPALGSDIHNELAGQIGAALADGTGCILVDSHQRTNVPGAYAAGDVVIGLDQISHAMGEGGVAATTIRNDLAELGGLMQIMILSAAGRWQRGALTARGSETVTALPPPCCARSPSSSRED